MKPIVNLKTKKQLTKKEKQILDNLTQAVDFVKKYNKGKVRAKSFNQLLNETN